MLPHILAGEKLFKLICASDKENVKDCISNLKHITNCYVIQWTSEVYTSIATALGGPLVGLVLSQLARRL